VDSQHSGAIGTTRQSTLKPAIRRTISHPDRWGRARIPHGRATPEHALIRSPIRGRSQPARCPTGPKAFEPHRFFFFRRPPHEAPGHHAVMQTSKSNRSHRAISVRLAPSDSR